MTAGMGRDLVYAAALLLARFYMLPALIANIRNIEHLKALTWINLLLGWTGIGWLITFVWAYTELSGPGIVTDYKFVP